MKQVQVPEFDFEFDESFPLYGDLAFHHEMRELLRGEVSYGEGDNKEKARRVLEYGSQQILNDETSSPFMRYVAICFKRHLEGNKGKKVSLDVAFSREQGLGRPKDDPAKFDPVVFAYYSGCACVVPQSAHVFAYYLHTLGDPTYAHTALTADITMDEEERRERSFSAAFSVHHGWTQDELRRKGIDSRSIESKKEQTRNLLQDRGLYLKQRKKKTRK